MANWTEKYSVHNELLDGQHKTLLDILGRMAALVEAKKEPEKMVNLLTEMSDYAIAHFKSEEEHMQKIGFPKQKFEEHVELHSNYTVTVLKFTFNHLIESPDSPKKVLEFLIDWWTNHILTIDKEYAKFEAAKNAS